MATVGYQERRGELETYFDRTAAQAWARLTSTAPVGRIRATVRAGRERMRSTLLDYLPADLRARRVLDAGCGTGAFSAAAADRGARVIAIDLSGTLIALARERLGAQLRSGRVEYRVGDMSDPALGRFDHVVAMDSLIHYPPRDVVRVLALWAARTTHSILFTFAPSTPALAAMHAIGRCFPRRERAPAIEPIAQRSLFQLLTGEARLAEWHVARTQRIESGFYTSQAVELVRR